MKKVSRKNMQLLVLCGILIALGAFFGLKSPDFLTSHIP